MYQSNLIKRGIDNLMLYALQKENPIRFLIFCLVTCFVVYSSAVVACFLVSVTIGIIGFVSLSVIMRPYSQYFEHKIDTIFKHNPLRF